MRAVIETVFDIFYLVTVLTVGIRMIRGSKAGTQFRLFGLMAVVLGAGDSFHLVPRALALCTTGLENYAVPLGLGMGMLVLLLPDPERRSELLLHQGAYRGDLRKGKPEERQEIR